MGFMDTVVEIGEGLGELIVTSATTVSKIFFVIGENGAFTIQPLGYIALIGLAGGVVWKAFNFVKGLVKSRA